MSTEMLCKAVQKAMTKKGWRKLTEPQKQAIPVVLSEKNMLLIAPTGMGKTEAVMLPIFNKRAVSKVFTPSSTIINFLGWIKLISELIILLYAP